ncbi:MAG: methyltransferase domain-containing protein [Bacillota bacterium]|nr:methyltransferase domain-containing protein [Bacillota bacterium]
MLNAEMNEIGQFIPLHYHYQMLSDASRMNAFRTAIEEIVTPRHKVAELGSGTGALSFFAARKGAQVWSVEFNPALVSASQKFLNENGLAHKVHISQGDAANWLPPEPVDLVICEMLHSALLREKQLQIVAAFRDAHMARFGKAPGILPAATLLGVQPIFQCYDFNGYYAPVPLFQSPYYESDNCGTCGDPVVYKVIEYDKAYVETFEASVSFSFNNETNVNALRFITKSLLTMDLFTGKSIDWHSQYLILPLSKTYELKAGQVMNTRFIYRPGDPIEALSNAISVDIVEQLQDKEKDQLSLIA